MADGWNNGGKFRRDVRNQLIHTRRLLPDPVHNTALRNFPLPVAVIKIFVQRYTTNNNNNNTGGIQAELPVWLESGVSELLISEGNSDACDPN